MTAWSRRGNRSSVRGRWWSWREIRSRGLRATAVALMSPGLRRWIVNCRPRCSVGDKATRRRDTWPSCIRLASTARPRPICPTRRRTRWRVCARPRVWTTVSISWSARRPVPFAAVWRARIRPRRRRRRRSCTAAATGSDTVGTKHLWKRARRSCRCCPRYTVRRCANEFCTDEALRGG